jgi:hypothetical protein
MANSALCDGKISVGAKAKIYLMTYYIIRVIILFQKPTRFGTSVQYAGGLAMGRVWFGSMDMWASSSE